MIQKQKSGLASCIPANLFSVAVVYHRNSLLFFCNSLEPSPLAPPACVSSVKEADWLKYWTESLKALSAGVRSRPMSNIKSLFPPPNLVIGNLRTCADCQGIVGRRAIKLLRRNYLKSACTGYKCHTLLTFLKYVVLSEHLLISFFQARYGFLPRLTRASHRERARCSTWHTRPSLSAQGYPVPPFTAEAQFHLSDVT